MVELGTTESGVSNAMMRCCGTIKAAKQMDEG